MKGTAKAWIGWVIAIILFIAFLAIYLTGTHEIFIKKILDTVDLVIKIIEVGP